MPEKRIHRESNRSPEEIARIKTIRDQFQVDRPSVDDLIQQGHQVVSLEEFFESKKRI